MTSGDGRQAGTTVPAAGVTERTLTPGPWTDSLTTPAGAGTAYPRPMTAPGNMQEQARADDERLRAARTAKIAERHETSIVGEPFLRAFHLRMATIHRQVQRQHLAAAALHAARADRLRAWLDVAGGCPRPSHAAIIDDLPPVARPADSHDPGVTVRPGRRRVRSARLGPGGRRERRRAPEVAAGQVSTFLVTLVESLEVDGDVGRFCGRFVARCVALLGVTAATMLVADHEGSLRITAWSSERARLFTAAELYGGEGPSVECHLTGSLRAYPTTSALAAHWPRLAGTASAADMAAVYALPLRRQDDALGVLTLFDSLPGRVSDDALRLVGSLAKAAAIGLANKKNMDYYQRVTAQLQSALTSRVAIEQAKGMLAERLGLPVDAAFELLRSHARGSSRNLHEVAARIIDRSLDIAGTGPDRTAPLPRTHMPSR